MTGADVPAAAQEAMVAAEAAWYERDGIDPREAWQAGAHAGWAAGWAAGSRYEVDRVTHLVHLLRVLHKPVKHGSGKWLTCHGCDLGPHPEDYPDWPCSTAELVFTPEEIAAHEGGNHA